MKLSINLKSRIHEIKHMPSLKNMEPFLERMPKNSVKELHLTNGHGDGLLNEAFIMNLKKIFPHLEKLVINPVIDSWDRHEGRHVVLPWKI